MFSLLRARWGKVNSLGISRMKGALLWLGTKCNRSLSLISKTCTGLFVGELDVPYRVSEHSEWGLSPPCVVTQIPHVFWHSKLKSLSCLVQAIPLINWNLPYHQTYQNLLSNEGVTYSPPAPPFFFLGWKWRFLGSSSHQPAQLSHNDQRADCDRHSREAKDKVLKMLSALPKTKWECGHWPPNTLLFLKKAFLYKRKGLVQSTKAKHLLPLPKSWYINAILQLSHSLKTLTNKYTLFLAKRRSLGSCLLRKQEHTHQNQVIGTACYHALRQACSSSSKYSFIFKEQSMIMSSITMENYTQLSRDFSYSYENTCF